MATSTPPRNQSRSYSLDQSLWVPTFLAAITSGILWQGLVGPAYGVSSDTVTQVVLGAIVFLGNLTVWHLLLKYNLVRRDARFTRVAVASVFEDTFAKQPRGHRDPAATTEFQEAVRAVSRSATRNMLYRRITLLLDSPAREGSNIGAAVVELDRDSSDQSYAMPRLFIWAMPLLGFIGTVIGISSAIGGFALAVEDIGSAPGNVNNVLSQQLPGVTRGLSTAFDTTLLGLLASLPSMLILTVVQRAEARYLGLVDRIWACEVSPILYPTGSPATGQIQRTERLVADLGLHLAALDRVVSGAAEPRVSRAPGGAGR